MCILPEFNSNFGDIKKHTTIFNLHNLIKCYVKNLPYLTNQECQCQG